MANTQINVTANGTKTLATAGKYCDRNIDVNVNVPASGITPTGTKTITANGTHDVTSYASANVNVPVPSGYIKPSGTKTITENGTHDVTSFASAIVNVSGGKVTTEVHEVTFASDLGNGTNTDKAILTGNAFVKANYAKNGFAVLMYPVSPVPMTAANVVHAIYHGNANIGASDASRVGFAFKSNSASSMGFDSMTSKISGTNYNACFRARSTGNLNIYVASGRIVKAGTYKIVLMCWED